MGFTTGFLGGITLTTTLLYLTLNLHTRNRIQQAAALHQNSLILNNIVEPQPPLPPPTSREIRTGIWSTAKDRWNSELEHSVRRLQRTDWSDVRERMEEGVSRVWRRAFVGAEEGVRVVEREGEKGLRRLEAEGGKAARDLRERVELESSKAVKGLREKFEVESDTGLTKLREG